MTIAELAPGQSGVIAAYRGADAEERHLLDMGLTPGVRVRLIGTALLGDHCLENRRRSDLCPRRKHFCRRGDRSVVEGWFRDYPLFGRGGDFGT